MKHSWARCGSVLGAVAPSLDGKVKLDITKRRLVSATMDLSNSNTALAGMDDAVAVWAKNSGTKRQPVEHCTSTKSRNNSCPTCAVIPITKSPWSVPCTSAWQKGEGKGRGRGTSPSGSPAPKPRYPPGQLTLAQAKLYAPATGKRWREIQDGALRCKYDQCPTYSRAWSKHCEEVARFKCINHLWRQHLLLEGNDLRACPIDGLFKSDLGDGDRSIRRWYCHCHCVITRVALGSDIVHTRCVTIQPVLPTQTLRPSPEW